MGFLCGASAACTLSVIVFVVLCNHANTSEPFCKAFFIEGGRTRAARRSTMRAAPALVLASMVEWAGAVEGGRVWENLLHGVGIALHVEGRMVEWGRILG